MITGIRGLCNGLGPALFGFIFFLFNVELKEIGPMDHATASAASDEVWILLNQPQFYLSVTVRYSVCDVVFAVYIFHGANDCCSRVNLYDYIYITYIY